MNFRKVMHRNAKHLRLLRVRFPGANLPEFATWEDAPDEDTNPLLCEVLYEEQAAIAAALVLVTAADNNDRYDVKAAARVVAERLVAWADSINPNDTKLAVSPFDFRQREAVETLLRHGWKFQDGFDWTTDAEGWLYVERGSVQLGIDPAGLCHGEFREPRTVLQVLQALGERPKS